MLCLVEGRGAELSSKIEHKYNAVCIALQVSSFCLTEVVTSKWTLTGSTDMLIDLPYPIWYLMSNLKTACTVRLMPDDIV